MKGKTKSGFKFEINENKLRSWEFANLAEQLSDESQVGLAAPKYIKFVLGDEQADRLAEHTVHDGFSDITRMMEEVSEIVTMAGEQVKKSSASSE